MQNNNITREERRMAKLFEISEEMVEYAKRIIANLGNGYPRHDFEVLICREVLAQSQAGQPKCPKCYSTDLDERGNCYACLAKKNEHPEPAPAEEVNHVCPKCEVPCGCSHPVADGEDCECEGGACAYITKATDEEIYKYEPDLDRVADAVREDIRANLARARRQDAETIAELRRQLEVTQESACQQRERAEKAERERDQLKDKLERRTALLRGISGLVKMSDRLSNSIDEELATDQGGEVE